MLERFLVMDDGVIHSEPKQNRSKAHADHIDIAINQSAQSERSGL